MKVLHVVGARPNFMKVAPVMAALAQHTGVTQCLVHTGQHYDANMSDIFFTQLGLPKPDLNLEVGSGSHAVQTAQTMIKFEEVLLTERPEWVVVYGDINSTVAAALVAAKLQVPVAHVEAGLRSGDRTMPEELNRLVTDQLADLLLTPSADGDENLRREGIAPAKIHCVGNVMIDTLVRLLPVAETLPLREELALPAHGYGLITLHRPSNVDEPVMLQKLMATLLTISQELPLLFPIHPRTRQRLEQLALPLSQAQITFTQPLGYLEFLALQRQAKVVITDSGGIQEESTYLGVPCLTVRENTERPITVTVGTNLLVGQDLQRLSVETQRILAGQAKQGAIPPLWDGKAGLRIAELLLKQ